MPKKTSLQSLLVQNFRKEEMTGEVWNCLLYRGQIYLTTSRCPFKECHQMKRKHSQDFKQGIVDKSNRSSVTLAKVIKESGLDQGMLVFNDFNSITMDKKYLKDKINLV